MTELKLSPLTALSPIDGRYAEKTKHLRSHFSEYGLIRHRVLVEIRWLILMLQEVSGITLGKGEYIDDLNYIVENFIEEDAQNVKYIDDVVNHDVKAVEYFLQNTLKEQGLLYEKYHSLVHFACTSEDINNLSYSIILRDTRMMFLLPVWKNVIDVIYNFAKQYAAVPMLSRTHGQPASPTTFGKEFAVFYHRLNRQYKRFEQVEILGKVNGSVGNFNAHMFVVPELDWEQICRTFVESFGLMYNPLTTQIESQDYMVEYFSVISTFNSILIDICVDLWGYVSLGYLCLKKKQEEVGSSVMPHKVNPINFENAEGNLKFANAVLTLFQNVLPISRFQRDLSNSTILRNIGVGIAHCIIAYDSFLKGMERIDINTPLIEKDLNERWELLAEPIQTMLRFHGVDDAYEQLKTLTRGVKTSRDNLVAFIHQLPLPDEAKIKLLALTPAQYIGMAKKLVDRI